MHSIGIARNNQQPSKVTKRRPNYGHRRALSGWSSGAMYEVDVSDSVHISM